jgi:hypothetical protein
MTIRTVGILNVSGFLERNLNAAGLHLRPLYWRKMTRKKSPDPDATSEAVAGWMRQELEKQDGVLYQEDAASQIGDLFGEQFIYENPAGNPAIDKKVLAAFRKLTGDSVVWSSAERHWRRREVGDEPGRKQE